MSKNLGPKFGPLGEYLGPKIQLTDRRPINRTFGLRKLGPLLNATPKNFGPLAEDLGPKFGPLTVNGP